MDDVFAIQDEISRAIVNRLRLSIGAGRRRYQTNLAAYEAYLRARVIVDRAGTNSGRTAAPIFEQVIAMEPGFAPAHAGLADAYAAMSWQLGGLSNEDGLEGMRPAAERALELDPLLAEAHAAMGIVWSRERDWARSEASFERAIALAPALTHIAMNYAFSTLEPTGQLEKAEAVVRTAMAADPLSPLLRRELGTGSVRCRPLRRGREHLPRSARSRSRSPVCQPGTGASAAVRGEARRSYRRLAAQARVGRRLGTTDYARLCPHRPPADVARLVEAHRDEHPYRQALIYAALGDNERTLDALGQPPSSRRHRTAQLLVSPEMAFLRGDPGSTRCASG